MSTSVATIITDAMLEQIRAGLKSALPMPLDNFVLEVEDYSDLLVMFLLDERPSNDVLAIINLAVEKFIDPILPYRETQPRWIAMVMVDATSLSGEIPCNGVCVATLFGGSQLFAYGELGHSGF